MNGLASSALVAWPVHGRPVLFCFMAQLKSALTSAPSGKPLITLS
jgi:hypothetical protein